MTLAPRFRLWIGLLVVAIATRSLGLGNPVLHVDEQFYFAAARAWGQGKILYADIYDRKPVGLFLIYLLPAQLPFKMAIWAYQLTALISAWATAIIASSIARRAGVKGSGMMAGLIYLIWIILAEGEGGQSPVFFNLLVASAAWLVLEDEGDRPLTVKRSLLAMALFGLALQVKPSVIFDGAFFGLWILWRKRAAGFNYASLAILGVTMMAIALVPTAIAAASFAAIGHFDAWWFATIVAIGMRNAPPWPESLGNLGIIFLILVLLLAMARVGLKRSTELRQTPRLMLLGWLTSSIVGLLLFGTWFDHYSLPTMLPASIAAAASFSGSGRPRRWQLATLILAVIAGQALMVKRRWERGTPAQFEKIVAAVGNGPGCLYVYAGDSMLYAATQRCAATRYTFPAFLTRNTETIAIDQRGEIDRILASRPSILVDSGHFRGEIPERRAQFLRAASKGYMVIARLPEGRMSVTVYRLRAGGQPNMAIPSH